MHAVPGPLDWLRDELTEALGDPGMHICVFGSAVMLLHGLREQVGDVDLFVTREAAARLSLRGWELLFPTPGDPPLLEWTGGRVRVHAFERWTRRDWWINVDEAWRRRTRVHGWPCVPLEIVARWKRQAHRYNPGSAHAKHLKDAERIDAYLRFAEQQRAAGGAGS